MAKGKKNNKGNGLIKRVGNFNIYKRIDKHGDWIIIESLIKDWQVRYEASNEMHSMLQFLFSFDSEVVDAYVERFVVSCFFHTGHLHDWLCMVNGGDKGENGDVNYIPFLTAYWKLIDDESKREAGYIEKASVEDEEKALKETELHENLMEEMKNIKVGEDGTVYER